MTNFEKWKQSLTVETAADLMVQDEDCLNCPIRSKCRSMRNCKCNFMTWAYAEAEEGAEQ